MYHPAQTISYLYFLLASAVIHSECITECMCLVEHILNSSFKDQEPRRRVIQSLFLLSDRHTSSSLPGLCSIPTLARFWSRKYWQQNLDELDLNNKNNRDVFKLCIYLTRCVCGQRYTQSKTHRHYIIEQQRRAPLEEPLRNADD